MSGATLSGAKFVWKKNDPKYGPKNMHFPMLVKFVSNLFNSLDPHLSRPEPKSILTLVRHIPTLIPL